MQQHTVTMSMALMEPLTDLRRLKKFAYSSVSGHQRIMVREIYSKMW